MKPTLLALFLTYSLSSTLLAQDSTSPLFLIVVNNKIGYMDQTGKVVVPPVYASGNDFSEGLAAVRLGGRYGFIDRTGHWAIEPKFDYAWAFNNGIAIVIDRDNPYFIDRTGHRIFLFDYAAVGPFKNGRAYVRTHSKKEGFVDLHGSLLIDTLYDYIGPFHDGRAVVRNQRKKSTRDIYGVIDTAGNIIVRLGTFEKINDFNEGHAVIETKDKTGLIDTKGKIVFLQSDKNNISLQAHQFHNGLGATNTGFIDLHNNILLNDSTITNSLDFSEGRSFIQKDHSDYQMIDTRMRAIGDDSYSYIQDEGFKGGYAIVRMAGTQCIIDTNAHIVLRLDEENTDQCQIIGKYCYYQTDQNDTTRWGITALNGRDIIKPCLNSIDAAGFVNGLLKASMHNQLTYLDTLGNIVWQSPPTKDTALIPLNIDYMLRGHFYAYSSPKKVNGEEQGGGWSISGNTPKKIGNKSFKENKLGIFIDTKAIDTFAKSFKGLPVYLFNTTKDTCQFSAQDSRLYMKMQAQDETGNWTDIEYLPSSWCGNSYHTVNLEPGTYWYFIIPVFEGEVTTKFRIQCQEIDPSDPKKNKLLYSNTFDGRINPGQFWNKMTYHPQGLMDPYFD